MSRSTASYHAINHVTIKADTELGVVKLELWHDKDDVVPCHRIDIFGDGEVPVIKLGEKE